MKSLLLPFSFTIIHSFAQIPNLPDIDGKFQAVPLATNNISPFNTYLRSSYTLAANFPIEYSYNNYDPKGGIVTANIDGDSDLEIIFGCGTHLYGINKDGSLVSGWNKSYSTGNDVIWPAAIGDIDGDNLDDVVVVAGAQVSGNLYAYDLNGNLKAGFPFTNIGLVPMMPVLADIDKNGSNEIIFSKRLSGTTGGEVYVLNGDGTVYTGWPFSMGTGEYPGSSVAVGDINNDGTIEIVGESKNKLWVWDKNGVVLNGFPFDLDASNVIINSYSSPILVDIDKDNQHEIIFCAHNPGGIIYVVKNDGTLYSGWPQTTTQWIYAPPIAADINNDGFMEIFVGDQLASTTPSSFIYGFDKNGNALSGFPYGPVYGSLNQLTVADLNNDGDWEFISDDNIQQADTSGQYIAINHDGSAFTDFPLITFGCTFYKQMVLDDIDNDGTIDFIGQGIDLNSNKAYLHLWNTPINKVSSKVINPFLQLNKRHDGYYQIMSTEINNIEKNDYVYVFPNPFDDNISIKSSEEIKEFIIYNVIGEIVFDDRFLKNEINISLKTLSSGIYTLELRFTDGTSKMKKVVKK